MYTWFIDYIYVGLILILFIVLPIFFLLKSKNKVAKFKIILLSFFLFSIAVILILFLKSLHIDEIQSICFDWTGGNYKNKDIPEGCYSFDNGKYMGIGWTASAIFWIVFSLIYHTIVYILWIIYTYLNSGDKVVK